ncbi:hypothetical protein SESBI_48464 [Sesbania bispinosa]|nr:hypothetical protein SESBI_48464 [Sesbania bispinosa]
MGKYIEMRWERYPLEKRNVGAESGGRECRSRERFRRACGAITNGGVAAAKAKVLMSMPSTQAETVMRVPP